MKDWWSRWGESSKADLRPVLASIKAHLPLTLQQLDVRDSGPLRRALRVAEQTQRKREQAPSTETLEIERESLDRLANLIKARQHQEFLWTRVNELMHRYGYRDDGVLLELAQNADDALAQAAEINCGPGYHVAPVVSSLESMKMVVRPRWTLRTGGGRSTTQVARPSQTVGIVSGIQDLYFMMLMNLSGKPGEVPGEASLSSTTGRFGLGFKSVHLLSSSPSVVSGFIAFSIAGGLLPLEQALPDSADSWMIEGRRATRVRLPLRCDVDANKLIQSLLGRFSYARVLLPVFARQVREVVVEGGPCPGVHIFDAKPIAGAPGWSIGDDTELPNHGGRWCILQVPTPRTQD